MKTHNVLKSNQKWQKEYAYDLDTMLDEVSIEECDDIVDNFEKSEKEFQINTLLSGWYAVADGNGINAYFSTETEALAYRLFLINRVLNG